MPYGYDDREGRAVADNCGNLYVGIKPENLDDLIDDLEAGGGPWTLAFLRQAREDFRKDVPQHATHEG